MNDKAVLVTGASRGIGRAIVLKLAEEGYKVGVHFKDNEEKAQEIVKRIIDSGGKAILLKADVVKEIEVRKMMESFVAEFGRIYGLVNNAGIYKRKKIDELELKDWHETLDTNLTSVFICTMFSLPHMREGGRIVNISSVLAHRGSNQGAHYAASKAGIIGFTKSLARELAPKKITVNAVAPGAIETDIIAGDTPEKRKERERDTPLSRVGEPEEIASTVAFLLSENGKYMTGETLNVNGGMWMV
jgi:3-oxoacyl-[acyl-carrier protein] reductase